MRGLRPPERAILRIGVPRHCPYREISGLFGREWPYKGSVPTEYPRLNDNHARMLRALILCGGTSSRARLVEDWSGWTDLGSKNSLPVSSLVRQGLVFEPSRGRMLLGPALGCVVGVAVGRETVRAVLVNAAGDTLAAVEEDKSRGQIARREALLERIRRAIENCLTSAQPHLVADGRLHLIGITVAWPAPIDRSKRIRGFAFDNWPHTPAPDLIRDVLDVQTPRTPLQRSLRMLANDPDFPIDAVNDANADIVAEALTQAKDVVNAVNAHKRVPRHSRTLISVRLASGVGMGIFQLDAQKGEEAPGEPPTHAGSPRMETILLNRSKMAKVPFAFAESRLIVGTHGFAGEIGHLPVAGPARHRLTATQCSCKSRNHLEGVVGEVAVHSRHVNDFPDIEHAPIADLLESWIATGGDTARRELETMGKVVGEALATSILLLDPAQITLTGPLALPEVAAGIHSANQTWTEAAHRNIPVTPCDDLFSAARGAAILLLRRHLYRPLWTVDKPSRSPTFAVQL